MGRPRPRRRTLPIDHVGRPRFAEQMRYDAGITENVVEVTKWVGWNGWRQVMTDLGYQIRLLSHNSMHHGVAQSRDRVYIVWWRKGLRPDLELELAGHCTRCDATRPCRQAWKNGRTVGRYRFQYIYACTTCGTEVVPATQPAASIIDWDLDCPRIGDRKRPSPTRRGHGSSPGCAATDGHRSPRAAPATASSAPWQPLPPRVRRPG